jgi:hypothetical protein
MEGNLAKLVDDQTWAPLKAIHPDSAEVIGEPQNSQ